MSAERQTLERALAAYRGGQFGDAERLYGEVLRVNPENADALHLLGLLYLDAGQPQAAAGLVSRAIQQRPDVPFFYNTLGNALRGLRRIEAAVLSFRKALSLDPDFAEALTNLGSTLEESGQTVEAVAAHRRAAELRPDCAEIHSNLGNALRSAGRPEQARISYETALRLRPASAEAWMNLGNLDFDRDEYAKAEKCYREAVRLNPRLVAALSNLGSALTQMGKLKEAETWCSQAFDAAPGDPAAQCNLASVLTMTGRPEIAEELCRRALAGRPYMPEAHTNLGLALARLHRLDEAEQHCRQSLALRPHRPTAHANLAHILLLTGRFTESEECLRQALALSPDHLRVMGCYGDLFAARLDLPGALRWYDRCLELAPEADLTRPARAMVWLAMGDFARGWEEYEFRWMMSDCPPAEFRQPQWNGEPFPGRTLLLHAEQGLGDTIQFIRFAPLAKRLGGSVILACQPALTPMLAGVAGVDRILPNDREPPECDCHLPLLSLPRVLKTRERAIPEAVPYLKVPAEAADVARRRLAGACGGPGPELRIGVVWAGNRKHPNDANRSMRVEHFAPLFEIPGARFVSLQQGQTIPAGLALLPILADTIEVTAAIVEQLDLTITVDSMIAHLAGAIGRPVWTLLSFAPDWRWMTEREDTPWYPHMRLFRQRRFGDWDEVIRRVRAELTRRIAEPPVLSTDSIQARRVCPR